MESNILLQLNKLETDLEYAKTYSDICELEFRVRKYIDSMLGCKRCNDNCISLHDIEELEKSLSGILSRVRQKKVYIEYYLEEDKKVGACKIYDNK